MYNGSLNGIYSPQTSIDRIESQIADLEKMKARLQQQPTNLTQNFQIAPMNREVIRYAGSIDEVQKEMVVNDTPYFTKDMSIVWIKGTNGNIKTYELTEIIPKDEKDIKIEYLEAQLNELKGMIESESNNVVNEPVADTTESQEPENVSTIRANKKKQQQSSRIIKRNDK